MSAYYDNLRFLTKCPDGKSLTAHVELLCARVEKLEKVRESAKGFLPLVNAVTAPHRHGQSMRKGALDNLSNGQLDMEAALAECGEVERGI